ncbi:MAG: class I SAM-dependent methyltransferase [Pseudomonadota bacterium]
MTRIISDTRFREAQKFESDYWISRQHDPVGLIDDLYGQFTLAEHLQREGYLARRFHRLLDVGCGGLGVGMLWLLQSEEAYGLEPLPVLPPQSGCKLLDEFIGGVQSRTEYVMAKAESIPFEEKFFDCVVCNNVLDHVHDPLAILTEIKRVLSPDGVFAFAVDAHSVRSLVHKKILKAICPNRGSLPGHPYEWTEDQMSQILTKHGFALVSHRSRSLKGRTLGRVRRTTWLLRHA